MIIIINIIITKVGFSISMENIYGTYCLVMLNYHCFPHIIENHQKKLIKWMESVNHQGIQEIVSTLYIPDWTKRPSIDAIIYSSVPPSNTTQKKEVNDNNNNDLKDANDDDDYGAVGGDDNDDYDDNDDNGDDNYINNVDDPTTSDENKNFHPPNHCQQEKVEEFVVVKIKKSSSHSTSKMKSTWSTNEDNYLLQRILDNILTPALSLLSRT
ncbi:hypothetical protein Glove_83g4 [Diversispora epigaea]|uniref:Uncharacterized protein n=1 Tax=Diversispora epigaea TaxID=1348612 RepID=A0A397JI83_9GLOM|nr:hypothetical protein Glove_83g4 [Diversispora epigaea]